MWCVLLLAKLMYILYAIKPITSGFVKAKELESEVTKVAEISEKLKHKAYCDMMLSSSNFAFLCCTELVLAYCTLVLF